MLDAIGLLLRRESLCLVVGERERRSNLEVRFGSGSVWSKRDRFVERRSSSAMLLWVYWVECFQEKCRILGVTEEVDVRICKVLKGRLVVRRENPSALECQARS